MDYLEIKILGLLSIFSLTRTVFKILRRNDLSCVDIILLFHVLYFGIIPLIGDVDTIGNKSILHSSAAYWYVFAEFNAFAYLLILFDWNYCKKADKHSLYFITKYMRDWIERTDISRYLLNIEVLFIVFQLVILSTNYSNMDDTILQSTDNIRKATATNNQFLSLFTGGGGTVFRLISIMHLSLFFHKRQELFARLHVKQLVTIIAVLQFILLIFISRTYLFESFFFAFLFYYALNKEKISNMAFLRMLAAAIIIVVLLFPVLSAVRAVNRYMIGRGHSTDLSGLVINGSQLIFSKKIDLSKADNKGSRMWGVYNMVAIRYLYDYEGNGKIISNAISKGIPKILYPEKSVTGSQLIIENELGIRTDCADSVLLAAVVENKYLGFLLAATFFLGLIFCYDFILNFFLNGYGCVLTVPLVLTKLLVWLNRVEFTIDGMINGLIGVVLLNISFCVLIYIIKIFRTTKFV